MAWPACNPRAPLKQHARQPTLATSPLSGEAAAPDFLAQAPVVRTERTEAPKPACAQREWAREQCRSFSSAPVVPTWWQRGRRRPTHLRVVGRPLTTPHNPPQPTQTNTVRAHLWRGVGGGGAA